MTDPRPWDDLPVGWVLCQHWHRTPTPRLRVVLAVLTLETAPHPDGRFVTADALESRWRTGLHVAGLLERLSAAAPVAALRHGGPPRYGMGAPPALLGVEPPSPELVDDIAAIAGIEVQDPPLARGEVSGWARLGRMARGVGEYVLAGRTPAAVLADLPVG